MHSQPGDRNCGTKAIGGVHHGPVLIYMAKVDDATTATTGSFFKVAEDGYQGSTPPGAPRYSMPIAASARSKCPPTSLLATTSFVLR